MANPLRIATFASDVTPPIGAALCLSYVKPAERIDDPLTCRGIVLLTDQQPIVLCAVDWLGISNGAYERWRAAIAAAVGTAPQRVCVQCMHPHDTPAVDTTVAALLDARGLYDVMYHAAHAESALRGVADAARQAMGRPQVVTHISSGWGEVIEVASNRRIVGPDGKVGRMRGSKCQDPALRAAPEGLIDPLARVVGLWNGDKPLACLSWYATHPQSYYNQGGVSCDFPGLARGLREKQLPGVAHLHFTGAAGDIAAGKYNDGAPENRMRLAQRLADGIGKAWQHAVERRRPVDAGSFEFRTVPVYLPPRVLNGKARLTALLDDRAASTKSRIGAAWELAWLDRCEQGNWPIDLTALRCGNLWIVNTPGEMSIEYQLAAQRMRPGDEVCLASYGEYGPAYICLEAHHAQGGYEPSASHVAPHAEQVMMQGLRELINA